jgi:nucleotide-binding universal stress UspA family protein
MSSGPVIIGFDGTPVAERAVHEAAGLLAPRRALVVVVWEAGRAFDLAAIPASVLDSPVAPLDLRTAYEVDRSMFEEAQRTAQWGALLATEAGLEAEGLAVADDVTVADTLVRLAKELDSEAMVVGSHRRGRLSEILLGSTAQEVLRKAPCPVVVVRDEAERR